MAQNIIMWPWLIAEDSKCGSSLNRYKFPAKTHLFSYQMEDRDHMAGTTVLPYLKLKWWPAEAASVSDSELLYVHKEYNT